MRRILIAGALSLALPYGSAQAVFGFCSQPTAPTTFLRKPTKPYCAINRNCEEWEVQAYRGEVERYFRNLKSYANDVESYYADAASYVECMSKLD